MKISRFDLQREYAYRRWLYGQAADARAHGWPRKLQRSIDAQIRISNRRIETARTQAAKVRRDEYDPARSVNCSLAPAAPPWMWSWMHDAFSDLRPNLWGVTDEWDTYEWPTHPRRPRAHMDLTPMHLWPRRARRYTAA